jgi:hypothetical protein
MHHFFLRGVGVIEAKTIQKHVVFRLFLASFSMLKHCGGIAFYKG